MDEGHVEALSDEILLRIFQCLKAEDIFRVVRVNKRFRNVGEDASLHRNINFGPSGENLQFSGKVMQNYVHKHALHLKSIVLLDCYWITPSQMRSILKSLHNLEEVDLTGSDVPLSVLGLLFQNNCLLSRLGWSIPCKEISGQLFEIGGEPTELQRCLQQSFMKLSSLKLRFHKLLHFETIVGIFPDEMTLMELLLEYRGQKSTSIIHSGSDYHVHIKSNNPFPAYLYKLHSNNVFLHFNLILMDFVTKVAFHAAETDQLTILLAPGSMNSLCWKYLAPSYRTSVLSKIDLSSTCLTAEQMNWLGSLRNLTYLNLQNVQDFKANLMKVVAGNCPKLNTLNLNNCADWIDEDLCALKMVCSSCPGLKSLNLGRICCHSDSNQTGNVICKIIGQMKNLHSLAIAPCCLVNLPEKKAHSLHDGLFKKIISRRSSLSVEAPNQCSSSSSMVSHSVATSSNPISTLTNEAAPSKTMSSATGYVTRHAVQQKVLNERVLQLGSGLDDFVAGLHQLEQLELIGVGYSSVFNVPDEYSGFSFVCPRTREFHDAALLTLKSCINLKSLTLAGLHGLGSFNSLIEITKHCSNLEYLSLANIGLPGNSMALSALPQALNNCHCLRKLRLDQPHYNLTERLMTSLQNCKRIESICIICKDGKIPKENQPYLQLFDVCKRLCVFQLFSGVPGYLGRKIQKEIVKRYQKLRPPLSVAVLHYSQSLTEDGLQSIPFAHLKSLTCFQTKVAV